MRSHARRNLPRLYAASLFPRLLLCGARCGPPRTSGCRLMLHHKVLLEGSCVPKALRRSVVENGLLHTIVLAQFLVASFRQSTKFAVW